VNAGSRRGAPLLKSHRICRDIAPACVWSKIKTRFHILRWASTTSSRRVFQCFRNISSRLTIPLACPSTIKRSSLSVCEIIWTWPAAICRAKRLITPSQKLLTRLSACVDLATPGRAEESLPSALRIGRAERTPCATHWSLMLLLISSRLYTLASRERKSPPLISVVKNTVTLRRRFDIFR